MKRVAVVAFVVAGAGLLSTSACDDGGGQRHHHHGQSNLNASCRSEATCGTCTPVVGCGWCFTGPGTGHCVDGPDDCSSDTTGFTWEPSGCDGDGGIAGDAGSPSDGGRVPALPGVGDGDASDDASDLPDAPQD